MPLYGGRTFAEWTTIEGPAPVRRAGRVFCGYSGGNYAGAYGTGEAVADHPARPLHRPPRPRRARSSARRPGLVEGPGHFSVVRPDLVHDWIVLHGRTPGRARAQGLALPRLVGPRGGDHRPADRCAPARPPLAHRPQPLRRPPGPPPRRSGASTREPGPAGATGSARPIRSATRPWPAARPSRWGTPGPPRSGSASPRPGPPRPGWSSWRGDARASVVIKPDESRWEATGPDGARFSHPLPTLGAEPFDSQGLPRPGDPSGVGPRRGPARRRPAPRRLVGPRARRAARPVRLGRRGLRRPGDHECLRTRPSLRRDIAVSHRVADEAERIHLLPPGEGAPKGRMRGLGFDIDPA